AEPRRRASAPRASDAVSAPLSEAAGHQPVDEVPGASLRSARSGALGLAIDVSTGHASRPTGAFGGRRARVGPASAVGRGALRDRLQRHVMGMEQTTAAIERYLADLGGAGGPSPGEPIVRDLLERAVGRLRVLCAAMLYRSYPRLARPPLNLEVDEMLGAVVARLLRALREVRPQNVRQFFGLATRHM